jgi:hypothetical protein
MVARMRPLRMSCISARMASLSEAGRMPRMASLSRRSINTWARASYIGVRVSE